MTITSYFRNEHILPARNSDALRNIYTSEFWLTNIKNWTNVYIIAINEEKTIALFTFLKSQFYLLLIISHLDSVRDVVDNLIDIKKVAGFSKITHE